MEEKNKAVLYTRVSSKEQEQEGYSIPAQLKLLREYASKSSLEIIKEFIEAETAKETGRLKFNELLAFVSKSPDKYVLLCEKEDRLYRNWSDAVKIDDLRKQGLEIHFVKNNLILKKDSQPTDTLVHDINLSVARHYILNLARETSKGMKAKAEQGTWPSYAPLGYRNVEEGINGKKFRKIVPDPERAPIIRKLFELYATGTYSLRRVRALAYESGLRGLRGNKVHTSAFEKILKNPFYHGSFLWKGKLYQGDHPPIISRALYDAVQRAFDNHARPRPHKHNFAFIGLVRCGKCGCSFTADIHKGRHIYYHCTQGKGRCRNGYPKEQDLDQQFAEALKVLMIGQERLDWLKETLEEMHQNDEAYQKGRLEALRGRHEALKRRLEQMYIDKLDGKIPEKFYEEKFKAWQKELEEIETALRDPQENRERYYENGVKILELGNRLYPLFLQQSLHEKRTLVQAALSNSTYLDGTLYPTYRKPYCWVVDSLKNENWLPREDSNLRPSGYR